MKTQEVARRDFLRRAGQGVLVASLGSGLAQNLGISTTYAEEGSTRLTFGDLEPLVATMQETPLEQLQPLLASRLKDGSVNLTQLIQAAALANARTFGGEDYIGMHTLMAFKPSFIMAQQLPAERQALAVFKVLYRNTAQIHAKGGTANERLQKVIPPELSPEKATAEQLRKLVHDLNWHEAESLLAAVAQLSPEEAFNDLLRVVEDGAEVHRVVFAHRAWDTLDLVGMDNAEAMLRQSLRYCLRSEKNIMKWDPETRAILPKLLDQHKVLERPLGTREADDAWIEEMSRTIFTATPEAAGDAVAAALADGMAPRSIAEAISLATNQLILRDAGRTEDQVQPGKPLGSVHGDSIGVHACDSANAWRKIAAVSYQENTKSCLILAGFQAARDRVQRGGDFLEWQPRPDEAALEQVKAKTPEDLLNQLEGAIREQDQSRACAITHVYGEAGHDHLPLQKLLLRYATSEDGALHAEKYYLTATTDFADTRPAFRWRHLVGLARVTASESGTAAAGYEEACDLLKVPV